MYKQLGPKTEALKNFLWMKNLSQVNSDMKCPYYECWPHEPYLFYSPPMMKDAPGRVLVNKTIVFSKP